MKLFLLLNLMAALLLLPGCDPIRVTTLRAPPCEESGARLSITDAAEKTMLDRISQITLAEGLEEVTQNRTGNPRGRFFEGSYEVCGLISCSRKQVSVEISLRSEEGKLDVRIVDWFSFRRSQYAKDLSNKILQLADAEFGVGRIGVVKNGCI